MPAKPRPQKQPETLPPLTYIENLLAHGFGDIKIGRIEGHLCVATACDEDQQLALLVRKKGESLASLLTRLEQAIQGAYEYEIFTNELNDRHS